MKNARFFHSATLLQNGKVLVAGGNNGTTDLVSAKLYDPSKGTWTVTGSMAEIRDGHTATLLQIGDVLVAGGSNENGLTLATAELYNPLDRHVERHRQYEHRSRRAHGNARAPVNP